MKYIEEYLNDVIRVKSLGELTTEDDELNGMSGEMVYIDGKCSNIFISHADYANWLEKQGKHDIPKFTFDDVLALQCCMETVKKVQEDKDLYNKLNDLHGKVYDAYQNEKQSEQKPVDKVEPKFKVGDWITNCIETVQITGYDIDYGYQVNYKGNLQHRDTDIIEKEYHLWTIQDAKDGDILITVTDKAPFIFKGFHKFFPDCPVAYGGVVDENFDISNGEGWWDNDDVKPANKEQRNLLFQKMKEACYEWDAKNKKFIDLKYN